MDAGNRDVNSAADVIAYLVQDYEVDKATAMELVKKEGEEVERAIRLRSMAYYPGDKIARRAGLKERPGEGEGDEEIDEE